MKKKLSGLVVFMELSFVTWFQALLGFASLIWFIVGSVFVFKCVVYGGPDGTFLASFFFFQNKNVKVIW